MGREARVSAWRASKVTEGRAIADNSFTIHYSTTSEQLASELQELLAEFGVVASWYRYSRQNGDVEHRLSISGLRNVRLSRTASGFSARSRRSFVT